jgi:DNA-binding response OmpR family regulator
VRILVVEDEPRIGELIQNALAQAAYVSSLVANGEDAWFEGDTGDFDAIILDLGLPTLDGMTILKRWREAGYTTPILVLTARDGWREKVEGIDAGADDYLTKPFRAEELLARLRAITRRAVGRASAIIKAGSLEIDTRHKIATVDGEVRQLTAMEYRALAYLAHHQGRTVSQVELADHIYDGDMDRDANTIEVLIGRIRRKIGADLIETRRGHGYVVAGNSR